MKTNMESICQIYKQSLKEILHRKMHRKIKDESSIGQRVFDIPTQNPISMTELANLSTCPWFWPSIGGHESDILLRYTKDGTFLIRRSFSPGQLFTLSYKEGDRVRSMRIQQKSGYFSLDFSSLSQAKGETLEDLMNCWQKQAKEGYFNVVKRSDGVIEKIPFRLHIPLLRPITLKDHCRKEILEQLHSIDDVETLNLPITLELYLKELCVRQRSNHQTSAYVMSFK